MQVLVPQAERNGQIVLVPEFDPEQFPGIAAYNFGGVRRPPPDNTVLPRDHWNFGVIDRLFHYVRQAIGSSRETFGLFGNSAGAQFVLRYLALNEAASVDVAVAANCGCYMLPDLAKDYPDGMGGIGLSSSDLRRYLGRSLVILLGDADNDPDAPDPKAPKTTWVHWVLYNIPASATSLPEGADARTLPSGAREGLNDWKKSGYGGPCPPIGRHRYFHKLYSLDVVLPDLGRATKADLERAMRGHVLAEAQLHVAHAGEGRVDRAGSVGPVGGRGRLRREHGAVPVEPARPEHGRRLPADRHVARSERLITGRPAHAHGGRDRVGLHPAGVLGGEVAACQQAGAEGFEVAR